MYVPLLTANSTLLTANSTLLTANNTLLTANSTLLTGNSTLLTGNGTLLKANRTLLMANGTLPSTLFLRLTVLFLAHCSYGLRFSFVCVCVDDVTYWLHHAAWLSQIIGYICVMEDPQPALPSHSCVMFPV